ncbi:hypothetical protein TruAng_012045 [Truncatella angustata]|nr:hypothetical protein TruAng_012045 [Truncatella angustata]
MAATSSAGTAATLLPHLFPERKPMTPGQITAGINAALEVQRRAVTFGKRPFAAVLLGPDNETVLLTHQSIDQVNHAESSLARLAYTHYTKEFLWQCTLVSTWEPCGMCTATIYVSSVSRLFEGASGQASYGDLPTKTSKEQRHLYGG